MNLIEQIAQIEGAFRASNLRVNMAAKEDEALQVSGAAATGAEDSWSHPFGEMRSAFLHGEEMKGSITRIMG